MMRLMRYFSVQICFFVFVLFGSVISSSKRIVFIQSYDKKSRQPSKNEREERGPVTERARARVKKSHSKLGPFPARPSARCRS